MTDFKQRQQQTEALNKTPLSQHVKTLFQQEGAKMESGLVLGSLMYWAEEQQLYSHQWLERVTGAVAMEIASGDLELLYETLAVPGMEDAETLEEAARLSLSNVMDWIIPANSPAAAYH
jgi:purine-nucleoside phosphorylase